MPRNLSIRASLTATIVLLAISLVIGAVVGLVSLYLGNRSLQQMYGVDTPAITGLSASAEQLLQARLALATAASLADLGSREDAAAMLERVNQYLKVSDERLTAYLRLAETGIEDRQPMEAMQRKRDAFLQQGIQPAVAALKADDRAEFLQLQARMLPPLYSDYERSILALEALQLSHSVDGYRNAQTRFYIVFLMVGLGLLGSIVVSWMARSMLIRAIVRPIGTTIAHFERIVWRDNLDERRVASRDHVTPG